MSIGKTPQEELFEMSGAYCAEALSKTSVFRLLAENGEAIFPDTMFEDLYCVRGRQSVPPRVVATMMVLQRLEGLSDREAVEKFSFDVRWKYACGNLRMSYPNFVHTVLVETRARLAKSERPNRIFEAVLEVAKEAGFIGRKRILDSTPLYDAVATQDTVTLVRSGIRGVLKATKNKEEARAVLKRNDTYEDAGKPKCDWDDEAAQAQMVDELSKDGYALLGHFIGKKLSENEETATKLLATLLGQDLEKDATGKYFIPEKVAKDRVISTVDTEARHGRKSSAHGFDGFKAHMAIDADSEIIVATEVTAANVADSTVVEKLASDILKEAPATPEIKIETTQVVSMGETAKKDEEKRAQLFGDSAYSSGVLLAMYLAANVASYTKIPAPVGRGGLFTKDEFSINCETRTVTCPAGKTVDIRRRSNGLSTGDFGLACRACALKAKCTNAKNGRSIRVDDYEKLRQEMRAKQETPEWNLAYTQTRPKVERKFAHVMRRQHGGRKARVRGKLKASADFAVLAAATNLKRLAVLLAA